ncbi:hypothetical protein [Thalassotalea sp. Y01]|uniref:hypothetical protein n=1 Tax=Thalassotalea sp. Y01 TaxID=2729613 RepID=UPI00145DCFF8|nr:hypothetical protein [Thalassotalea sp. Y01]NMP15226.1 hypothetical protein [Thalassotalea sp. Y01]
MPKSLRYPLAVILGWIIAIFMVYSVEQLGHLIYPPPADLTSQQQVNEYMKTAPVGALVFVIIAWFVATFVGGIVSCFIAKGASMMMAFFVGLLIFFGAISSLMMIDHPIWFSVITMVGIPIIVAYTGRYGKRFEQQVVL